MYTDPSGYFRVSWQYYISNSELWSSIVAVAGSTAIINRALFTSGTTIIGIIVRTLSNFRGLVALNYIPIWGQIAFGIAVAVVIAAAVVIVAALVQGKGIKIWANVSATWFKVTADIGLRIQ